MRRFTICSTALVILAIGSSAQAAQITLTADDAINTTSFNTGLHWSNGQAPSAANTYVVPGFTLRTPPTAGNFTFTGSSLTISGGGVLGFKGSNGNTITINNCTLDGGDVSNAAGGGPIFNLAGSIAIGANGGRFNTVMSDRGINVTALLSGNGDIGIFGGGVVYLSNANTWTGNLAISTSDSNRLQLNNANAVQNGTLVLATNNVLTFGGGVGTFNLGGLAGNNNSLVNLEDTASNFINLHVGGNGQTTAFGGVLSGGGSLTKIGGGTLTLSGASTYTGGTAVNFGTLAIDGSILGGVTVNGGATLNGTGIIGGSVVVAAGGVVAPGMSPRTLRINGDYTQDAAAQLLVELGGSTPGTGYDQLLVTGTATLAGTLNVSLTAGFSPQPSMEFEILNWGSVNGKFNTLNLPTLPEGRMWDTSQLYSAGTLSVSLIGDYNGDGVVDAADYVVWRKHVGYVVPPGTNGDANGNGFVEWGDYQPWRENYGRTIGSTGSTVGSGYSVTVATVPEPATLVLFLAAGSAFVLLWDARSLMATSERVNG